MNILLETKFLSFFLLEGDGESLLLEEFLDP